MKIILISSILIFCLTSCLGYATDEIKNLPGLSLNTTFRQYSGYLTVGKGRYMHYWFVESQSNPSEDPVLLWLTGGPGCSSLLGLFTENGPFRVASDGQTLLEHKYSWNTFANVLYLESPVGVGFSYEMNSSLVSDDSTAEDNYSALKEFFEKFKNFSNNSFYITGESFAGIYIPMLAHKIFENNSTINLKGVAIGNADIDFDLLANSRVNYAYSHGLIDSVEYNNMVENCCKCSAEKGQLCQFGDPKNLNCTTASDRIRDNIVSNGIDPFNIYSECSPFSPWYSEDSSYRLRLQRFLSFSDQQMNDLAQSTYSSSDSDCLDYNIIQEYLNSVEVRKALKIVDGFGNFTFCSKSVNQNYQDQYTTMRPQVKDLVEKYKIGNFILYNGDLDIVCNILGDQQFVDDLGYKLVTNYTKWSVGGRTAGFVKRYEGITFMTVRNAGHMVSADQPEAALAILKELVGISKVN